MLIEKYYISFVIAVKNDLRSLEIQLDYFYRLESETIEFIYADGESTDGTEEALAHASSRDPRIRIATSSPDTGIYNAWNKALPFARGQYFCFLGVDDFPDQDFINFLTKKIEKYKISESYPLLVFGNAIETSKGNSKIITHNKIESFSIKYLNLLPFHHQGLAHHRDLFCSSKFDEFLKFSGDTEFLIRQRNLLKGRILYYQGIQVTTGSDGMSRSAHCMRPYFEECRYINEKLGTSISFTSYWRYILLPLSRVKWLFNLLKSSKHRLSKI
jgi:glycosyltransferase involved in cell wall biosynthesis